MRNLTKASRDKSRAVQFESLIKSGYKQITYKGLDMFTREDGQYFTLKVFRGNAANHEHFMNYLTLERRKQAIDNYIANYDSREAWKAEQKEKNKGKSSSHAAASAAIKAELKAAFPSVKFSVRSDSYSGGNSVHIEWTDGPTRAQVEAISGKHQYGSFNGMDDIYEYTNRRDDIPQAKYVNEYRKMSDETEAKIKAEILTEYNCELQEHEITRMINQRFHELDLLPKVQEAVKKSVSVSSVNSDKIQIIDYSEKAIAVTGNFSEHYDNLIKLGGAYNPRLKCGKGIIFSKKKLEEVKAYLIAARGQHKEEEQAKPEPIKEIEQEVKQEKKGIHTSPNIETPQNTYKLEYFKILWHEGRQFPNYTDAIFKTWEEVQTAFFNLWEVNEKGQDGGYTKVKCEIKFIESEVMITRIDITNQIKNGDFNPSDEHIINYLQSEEETQEEQTPTIIEPKITMYANINDIQTAAQSGKPISLYNLSQLVN